MANSKAAENLEACHPKSLPPTSFASSTDPVDLIIPSVDERPDWEPSPLDYNHALGTKMSKSKAADDLEALPPESPAAAGRVSSTNPNNLTLPALDEHPSWNPPPLDDASQQIRLLHVSNRVDHEDEELYFAMSTWNLEEIPEYRAISYVWGDASHMREIFIDGVLVKVRSNCLFALWQAQLHFPGSYLWIDALCIDQGNTDEKSVQVARMGEIYEEAAEVLACIGGHADDRTYPIQRLYSVAVPHALLKVHERLWCSISSLFDRPYFDRLWIYQELAVARKRRVLCGEDSVAGDLLDLALAYTREKPWPHGEPFERRIREESARVRLRLATGRNLHFNTIIKRFNHLQCADPRDRIYGLLPLISWNGHVQLEPDYQRTAFELAALVYQQLLLEPPGARLDPDIESLLSFLEVDDHDFGVRMAIHLRRKANHMTPIDLSWKSTPPGLCGKKLVGVVHKMETCDQGLSICPEREKVLDLYESERVKCRILAERLRSPGCPYKCLWMGGDLIGFVCEEAEAGDVLLCLTAPTTTEPDATCLVLHRQEQWRLSIIGLAFIAESLWDLTWCEADDSSLCVRTNLCTEDILLPITQRYLHIGDDWSYLNETAMERQSVTDPAVNPAPVAYLEWYDKGALDDEDDTEEARARFEEWKAGWDTSDEPISH